MTTFIAGLGVGVFIGYVVSKAIDFFTSGA